MRVQTVSRILSLRSLDGGNTRNIQLTKKCDYEVLGDLYLIIFSIRNLKKSREIFRHAPDKYFEYSFMRYQLNIRTLVQNSSRISNLSSSVSRSFSRSGFNLAREASSFILESFASSAPIITKLYSAPLYRSTM